MSSMACRTRFSTRLISEQKNSRSIFVAYPYEFSKDDYRGAFNEVAEEYEVEFTYADEQITSQQILEKVTRMIKESGFAIFDITNWNPNVALELGIATGLGEEYYVLFDDSKDADQSTTCTFSMWVSAAL
jgi:nucleoside 2-deoxyribosyltransferase